MNSKLFERLSLHSRSSSCLLVALQDAGIGTSIDSFYEYLLKASKMNWNLSDHNMIMLEDM